MNIKEIDKPEIKKIVVVYSGRFQPFHKGHYATYQKLVSKFGANNVYIGTSNDTSGPKSPFNFKEKKTIMTKMFGIPSNKIVQVKNPYAPKEVLNGMDGKTTAYIAAVGEKDASRLAGKYFKPYKGKTGYGYDEIGYVYAVPSEANPISGTDVRSWLGGDSKTKEKGFLKAYPKFDKDIFSMITSKLNEELYRGYPSEEQVKDIERKNKEFRNSPESTSDEDYLYDPISEILGRVAAEGIFEEFVKSYFKEESKGEKMGLVHLGGGYYGKDKGQPATHKSEDGNIRPLTPAEAAAEKQKQMSKGPSDAPANEPKPSQPGQPVNKGATAQGKIDKTKEEPSTKKMSSGTSGEQGPPPEQKLSGAELKSDAEKRADGESSEQNEKSKEVKDKLKKSISELNPTEQKEIETSNDPNSPERKAMGEQAESGWDRFKKNTMFGRFIAHKQKQYGDTGSAIKTLASGKRLGTIKDSEGKDVHWKDLQKKDEDGNPMFDKKPVYEKAKKIVKDKDGIDRDSKTGRKVDKDGNTLGNDGKPMHATNLLGQPKYDKQPIWKDDLTDEQKHLAHESHHKAHEQKHALIHTGIEAAFLVTGVAMAGGIAAGVGVVGKTIAKDVAKHAALETLGVSNPLLAGGAGLAAAHYTHHLLEGIYLNENSEKINPQKVFENIVDATIQKFKTYKLSDEQLLKCIEQYKKDKPKEDLANLLKENLSETKQQSINNFVEYATKRLKLAETPKITLVGGREFAEVKTSLGGYNPDDKTIYVATEGRLTADILRTLAHEMVHRKQDEMGLVTNAETDGADGSPIENQAHAIAGILMREYGRINKQIYNENVNETIKKVGDKYVVYPKNGGDRLGTHDSLASAKKQLAAIEINKEDVNVDVDKGDTVLMGKFKNKKVQVKDIGKDQHGMPTINGKQATTFRIPRGEEKSNPQSVFNEVGPNDWHFKAIMKMWDKAGSFGRKKIGVVVCNDPKADRNDVARKLRNYGYGEVTHVTDKLGLDENNSLNDLQKQRMSLYTKALRMMPNSPAQLKVRADIDKLSKEIERLEKKNINESILIEGGAYGHMSHPFDDMDLTFGDLKNIIKGALTGKLELTREKTDGQALAISWKNGRLIAARNKSHLQNGGAGAMGIEDVASKFGGRGGLTDAYNFAMKDLSVAIQSLSEAQRKKIFNEGQCFMNLEVIWPTSVNVIPYGQALLVFHNTTCYDEKGSAIGANQGAATMLAGMIKQVNADVQSKYTIQGPPVTELPKNEELSSKQTKYLTQLQKIQFQFQLSDKDGVSEYHQAWWEDFVNKSKVNLQKLEKEALVRRWAFGDKSFRLNTIADKDAQKWAMDNDKVNVAKQQKENVRQFEEIFLGVGADVLSFMGSVLTVNPDSAVRSMKDRLKSTADKVRGSGDPSKIAKLKMELSRLASIGGKDKIVPNEGIVFVYKGNTYKLTGTFAPLNQILGIFYE